MRTPVDQRPLTTSETRLLTLLTTAGDKGVSIDHMYETLYGQRPEHMQPESRIVPVIICSLRKKIRAHGLDIKPLRLFGYKLTEVKNHVVS